MIKIILVASLVTLSRGFPQGLRDELDEIGTCGYDSCPVSIPGKLNVHLVPHTHDDVGWLKTIDQYYFGSRTNIQNAGVQYIIDSVVNELLHDPKKKFIYVETAFFWKWWKEQTDPMRHSVKKLVKTGQLEFIGGAWSMNDEATTHYHSIIDQFTWGFRKLNDTFGKCGQPKIGWQIDPFGHSRETASMMAHFGFDGLFFGRLDYQDKTHRLDTQTMEMIWEGSSALGKTGDLLTGALYNHYSAPDGFCFDTLCEDDPFITNPKSPDYNVQTKVTQFLGFVKNQSSSFRTNNIILTMGDDFNYQDAHRYFKNLDILIRYVNERQKTGSKVNVFYSTPSCYVKSLNNANMTWPTKQDDFFPYASDPHAYWTGYFTSRPTLKYFERLGNSHLQVCKQLSSLALLGSGENPDIDALREAMGVMQHHDAITGTEKQHVANDYARILTDALKKCEIVSNAGITPPSEFYISTLGIITVSRVLGSPEIESGMGNDGYSMYRNCSLLTTSFVLRAQFRNATIVIEFSCPVKADMATKKRREKYRDPIVHVRLKKRCTSKIMTNGNPSIQALSFTTCLLTNISECSLSANSEKFIATVYNPLSRPVDYFVRLPVYGRSYSIKNPEGGEMLNQIVPIPQSVLTIPGRKTGVSLELVFKAEAVPPLGYRSYYVTAHRSHADPEEEVIEDVEEITMGHDNTQVTIDKITGLLSSVTFDKHRINLTQSLEYYIGHTGSNNKFENRASGAYIFRPKGNNSMPITEKVNVSVYKGPIVHETHQVFSDWASQVIRVYPGEFYAELEWLVGPVPIPDREGKEVISRFVTMVDNKGVFHTDSNGRQTVERRRDFRPTWNLQLQEPVSGNYYPVTTDISINDGELEVAVITDRAQGGSSLRDGEIELMVHRRLLHDDGFGVNEALNEEAYGVGLVARGRHWITLGRMSNPKFAVRKRLLQQEKVLSPQIVLTDATHIDFEQWKKSYKLSYSGLTTALPPEVQILTLEPWKDKTYLLRLEHILDKTECNREVIVNLNNLFSAFDIVSIRETTLGADRWLNEVSRLKWRKETNEILDAEDQVQSIEQSFPQVTLKPKQIKTFVCDVRPKKGI